MPNERIARSIRLPAELWAAIDAAAEADKRSANNFIEVTFTTKLLPEPVIAP